MSKRTETAYGTVNAKDGRGAFVYIDAEFGNLDAVPDVGQRVAIVPTRDDGTPEPERRDDCWPRVPVKGGPLATIPTEAEQGKTLNEVREALRYAVERCLTFSQAAEIGSRLVDGYGWDQRDVDELLARRDGEGVG